MAPGVVVPAAIPAVPAAVLGPVIVLPVAVDGAGMDAGTAGFPMVVPGAPITVDALPSPCPEVVPGCCTETDGMPGFTVADGTPLVPEVPKVLLPTVEPGVVPPTL